jgi:hypothetical protein
MKKGLFLFLSVLVIITVSCKLESPDPVVIDNQVDINYTNSQEEDLLDTSVTAGFSADSIHLYNVVNGIKKEVNNRVDYPHNFFIYKNEQFNKHVLRVFLEVDTTYLQLNRKITDTIACKFYRSENKLIITKVWYNGNLKWDNSAVSREFTIIK